MSVTVKRVDRQSRHCFLRADRRDGGRHDGARPVQRRTSLRILRKADRRDASTRTDVKRFIQIVLLVLLSPFVLFMLGLVLSIVRLGDFLTDDD